MAFIFRFWVALSFSTTVYFHTHKVQASGLCGLTKIDHGEICCNYQIHNVTTESGVKRECCEGHGLYIWENQLCCADQLIDKYEIGFQRKERKCCTSDDGKEGIFTPYNNELCCNGVVNKVLDGTDKGCCGFGTYDIATQRCCNSRMNTTNVKIVGWKDNEDCCGGTVFNIYTHWCKWESERVTKIGLDWCNGQEFDVKRKFCCEASYLVDRPSDLIGKISNTITCIQGHVFDSSTHHWDKSLNKTLTHDQQVCGAVVYNKNTEECCNDVKYEKKPQGQCCSSLYIDTNTLGCCRSEPYNKALEDCCQGQIKITRSPELECCGAGSINTTQQVCCLKHRLEIPTTKSKIEDNKCCNTKAGLQTYNEYTEVCKPEGVMPKPFNRTQISQIPRDRARYSPFCRRGKQEQMKKSCNHTYGFKGKVQDISGNKRRTILNVIIENMKKWKGKLVTMNIMVKSKCIQKWKGKRIVLFTDKVPKHTSKKGYFIKVTNKDFLMLNSRRNRNLVYTTCFRS